MLKAIYAATGFVAAVLLFQVQPLLGKRLLPWFGGSPSTWASCMLFFQLLLLVGYALSDRLVRSGRPRLQLGLTVAALAVGVAALPLGPSAGDRPDADAAAGALEVLALLARHAGPPCLSLAMASPLLQHWYERASERSPYALYAWSNAGSLLGLLAYPFAVEPFWPQTQQQRLWSAGFALFAAGMLLCGALALRGTASAGEVAAAPASPAPPRALVLRWLALSAIASALLLAITNQLTLDVAAVPFLWVAPLALYLLTFVIAFAQRARDLRRFLMPAWVASGVALAVDPFDHAAFSTAAASAMLLAALFVGCLLCHGELSRTRPPAAWLSRFYLALSAGGALGGLFIAGLAPLLLPTTFELPLVLLASFAVLLWGAFDETDPERRRANARFIWLGLGLCVPLLAGSVYVQSHGRTRSGRLVEQRRSFYGEMSVADLEDVRLFSHGRIRHGMQFRDPRKRRSPTLYYGPDSGVGRALRLHAEGRPREIGVIGLGAGTVAVYARSTDRFRFYELNPDVVALARRHFTFLSDAPARVDVSVGDARLALEREAGPRFDLLLMDAFASDAVPVHLLTVEAFAIYLRHLREDGLLVINVSNRHVDVERVVAGAAAEYGLALRVLETPRDIDRGLTRVRWALLAREQAELDRLLEGTHPDTVHGPPLAFTDDFSDLLSVLR